MTQSGENSQWVLGVDEVGRGPLAGPVAVGVALVPAQFDWGQIEGVTDSKRLSSKKREVIAAKAAALKERRLLFCSVAMVSAQKVDEIGISAAIQQALIGSLKRCAAHLLEISGTSVDWGRVAVKLDGGLYAPSYCCKQETIVKGDVLEPSIGLASIVAKVERDTYMCKRASETPYMGYGFERHKGYGTVQHRSSIAKQGLSAEHRRSYCKNIKIIV